MEYGLTQGFTLGYGLKVGLSALRLERMLCGSLGKCKARRRKSIGGPGFSIGGLEISIGGIENPIGGVEKPKPGAVRPACAECPVRPAPRRKSSFFFSLFPSSLTFATPIIIL